MRDGDFPAIRPNNGAFLLELGAQRSQFAYLVDRPWLAERDFQKNTLHVIRVDHLCPFTRNSSHLL